MSVTKRRAVRTIYFGRTLGSQLSHHFCAQRHMHTAPFGAFEVGIHTRKRRGHSCPFTGTSLHHTPDHLDRAVRHLFSHSRTTVRYVLSSARALSVSGTCLFR